MTPPNELTADPQKTIADDLKESQAGAGSPAKPDSARPSEGDGDSKAEGSRQPSDTVDPGLKKRVEDTEAWVKRLKTAQAEGHQLTRQDGKVDTPAKTDVDEVLGQTDERGFVEKLLDAAERRATSKITKRQQDLETVREIEGRVNESAPDVPMELFWAFSSQAAAKFPGDDPESINQQVEEAIRLSRAALERTAKRSKTREAANESARQSAETISDGGRGPRTGEVPEEKFADQVKSYQRSKA